MTIRHSDMLKEIGGRIRQTRFAKGVSMKIAHDIRAKYGVKLDPSYLSRIERGKTEIPLRTLIAIADYFEIKPAQLLDFSSETDSAASDYIFMDPKLVNLLSRLQDAVGEENARNHLRDLLQNVLKIVDSVLPRTASLKAARPPEPQPKDEKTEKE